MEGKDLPCITGTAQSGHAIADLVGPARLFISPRTVDTHLRDIFRELGITSRRQLKDLPGLRPST